MRKKDREIVGLEKIEAVLRRATVLRLGLSVNDEPYVVPVSFGYADGSLWVHSGGEGKKIEMLRQNDRVCFEAEAGVEILSASRACEFTARYQSVIGFGRARFVEDEAGKLKGLKAIMAQYSRGEYEFPANVVARTTVVRIDIESMTGKQAHLLPC